MEIAPCYSITRNFVYAGFVNAELNMHKIMNRRCILQLSDDTTNI